jgi:threonine dehydrogenase-like Zn-dependent dehydrogenase
MNASWPIPKEMRALVLDGTGFERLGIRKIRVPRPGDDQLLARVDAAGICTSLIKLIEQGPRHSLLYGWDIEAHPLILGDEGSITLVEVGKNLETRYHPGERYVVQPSVDHPPIRHRERYADGGRGIEKVAVGYTLPGHLAEYMLITEETVGAGCLLPLPDGGIPFAHAALAEPISCVISGQDHHLHLVQPEAIAPRQSIRGLKPGGVTLIVGAGAMGRMHADLSLNHRPRVLIVVDLIEERLAKLRQILGARAQAAGVELLALNPALTDFKAVILEKNGLRGADDVIVAVGSRDAIETAQTYMARGGVLNIFGGLKRGEDRVTLDTAVVHYREINVTGSSGGSPWDVARSLELMAEGEIDAGAHIARIGDLDHAKTFLEMVRSRQIDGKAVVYPHHKTDRILSVSFWNGNDERAHLRDSAGLSC